LSQTLEEVIELSQSELLDFCGKNDYRIRELESQFQVRIVPRGNTLKLLGPPDAVARARRLIDSLLDFSRGHNGLNRQQFRYAVESLKTDRDEDLKSIFSSRITVPLRKRGVAPMTAGQKHYLDAIRTTDIVFGIGRYRGKIRPLRAPPL